MSDQNSTFDMLKDWFVFSVAVITCVVGVVFWVQQVNDKEFARIESDIGSLKQDINQIRKNNSEILRIVGRLEGKIDK